MRYDDCHAFLLSIFDGEVYLIVGFLDYLHRLCRYLANSLCPGRQRSKYSRPPISINQIHRETKQEIIIGPRPTFANNLRSSRAFLSGLVFWTRPTIDS